MLRVAAAAFGKARARQVDDHRAHDVARIAKEVAAVLDLELARVHKSQVGFVDQRRGIEQGAACVAAEPRVRHAAQILVRCVEDEAKRRVVPVASTLQQVR